MFTGELLGDEYLFRQTGEPQLPGPESPQLEEQLEAVEDPGSDEGFAEPDLAEAEEEVLETVASLQPPAECRASRKRGRGAAA